MSKLNNFIYAVSLMIGTIVGVGIFGLPYAGLKAGFFVLIGYFLILTPILILIHLIFGELVCYAGSKNRLPGYVKNILGKKWFYLAVPNVLFGLCGSMLAYIIISGSFLSNIFSGVVLLPDYAWSLIFYLIGGTIIFLGVKMVEKTELIMLILLIGLVVLFFIYSLFKIDISNFQTFDLSSIFLPYGIIIYALWGTSIMPEAKELIGNDNKKYRKVIICSQLISAAIYLMFTFSVLGISGLFTTQDAIAGLKGIVSPYIIIGGSLFGMLAVFTSFISLGLTFKKVLWYDLKFSEKSAGLLTLLIPLILFLTIPTSFLSVIGLIGAVALGIDTVMVFLMYLKMKNAGKNRKLIGFNVPNALIYTLIAIFLIGVVIEVVQKI